MTSRKSSLSLAQPIQMPDDLHDGRNDNNSHRIEIFNNPIDQHVANCNGAMPLHSNDGDGDDNDDHDDKDIHVNTVL